MTELNGIRRDEAHNRDIPHERLQRLKDLHDELLAPIAVLLPDVVPEYLIERWRQRLTDIVASYTEKHASDEHMQGRPMVEVTANIDTIIDDLCGVETELSSIAAPPGKGDLHDELARLFCELRTSFEQMVHSARVADTPAVKSAAQRNEEIQGRMKAFAQKYLFSES